MPDPLLLFDYKSLDLETSDFLILKADEIKSLIRQTVKNVIRTGQILLEVKERLPHGQWTNWCEIEFGWNQRTAIRMMRVAEHFNLEDLSDLDIGITSLYILAAPTTPDEARNEAVYLARHGQKITTTAAQFLRDEYLRRIQDFGIVEGEGELDLAIQEELDLVDPVEVIDPLTSPKEDFQPTTSTEAELKQSSPTKAQDRDTSEETTIDLPQTKAPEKSAKPERRERLKRTPGQQDPIPVIDRSLITSKAKTVEAGQTWRLGAFHILFCGEPTDPKFLKRLPRKTPLFLEFPIIYNPLSKSFIDNFESYFAFTSKLNQDFDLSVLREAVESIIEGSTDGGEGVVLYRLPDPAIFLLIDQLECIAYCAEPDPHRCNMAIAAWTAVTKKVACRT